MQDDAKWPTSADNRLLRFMFDNNFFVGFDRGDDIPADLHKILRKGTEIEEMNSSEEVKFRNLVTSRVEGFTNELTKEPFFILAFRRDGVIRITDRFERMWKYKQVYWEDGFESSISDCLRPTKKRKKSKFVRPRRPIVLSNLRKREGTMSELLSAQIGPESRTELEIMAETALELSVDQEQPGERQAEQPSFVEVMVRQTSSGVEILLLIRCFNRT
jgi:hypothetical protein